MDEVKVKIKLTNLRDEPLRHPEYAVRQDVEKNGVKYQDVWVPNEDGVLPVSRVFRNGDVIELSVPSAMHLITSGQGIPEAVEDVEKLYA